MLIKDGFIYILENVKESHLVHSVWEIAKLFKIFIEKDNSKMRLVFKQENSQKLISKDFKSDQF